MRPPATRPKPLLPPRGGSGSARAQPGAALLAAMITVALIATLAAAALWQQWRGVEIEAAERARAQADWILTGALDWGRLILAGDARNSSTDHLGEPWAVPLAEARLSTFLAAGESGGNAADADADAAPDLDAFLSGQVTDLQSRLNLMNLALGSAQDQLLAITIFTRLFELLNLPASELGALQRGLLAARQAMAGDSAAAGGGNSDGNAAILPQRFEQLTWLGLSRETLATLAPHATLLPDAGITPLNLNTASAEAIYAALPGIDLAKARQLVSLRQQAHFRSAADALGRIGAASSANAWVGVRSNYFEIQGRLRLDNLTLQEVAVVRRGRTSSGQTVTPLWRVRTPLTAP
ncbi:MAG: type II secretion system minor pseudopilin GspK [Burkholderiaceae bacterium]|jgi:general secretion pathway protein K|nr:type II secretion system minor pseudopilin GspK [Burkholderiaceae bacterium]